MTKMSKNKKTETSKVKTYSVFSTKEIAKFLGCEPQDVYNSF